MSLDNVDIVDAIGTEKNGDAVVLSIIDSWDWADERRHLAALQDKLNAYFDFVESGQIYEDYPDAIGRKVRIDVVVRYPFPDTCLVFLERASNVASQLNVVISHRMHGG